MLDVKRMRVLREVAAQGSFSAAAEALAYTQSAVSQQIAALEREAGTRLVEAHRIAATPDMADALEIALGAPVVQLKRLRLGNGLPIGIQLIGPYGGDDMLLELGSAYEAAAPWADRWPAL